MKHDPKQALVEFARSLADRAPGDRATALFDYIEKLMGAVEDGQQLAEAWTVELRILNGVSGQDSPPPSSTPTTDGGAALRKFVSGKKKISVRRAALAAIYFLGSQTPKEIAAALEAAGYRPGKGDAGDNVRSALWHARKARDISEKDGKQGFVSAATRAAFAKKEGLSK